MRHSLSAGSDLLRPLSRKTDLQRMTRGWKSSHERWRQVGRRDGRTETTRAAKKSSASSACRST